MQSADFQRVSHACVGEPVLLMRRVSALIHMHLCFAPVVFQSLELPLGFLHFC